MEQAHHLPKYPMPAVLIGRMASGRKARVAGMRIGSRLLIHALKQVLIAAEVIGVQAVIVDSKPEAAAFYRGFGFQALSGAGQRLYLPVGTIRRLQSMTGPT